MGRFSPKKLGSRYSTFSTSDRHGNLLRFLVAICQADRLLEETAPLPVLSCASAVVQPCEDGFGKISARMRPERPHQQREPRLPDRWALFVTEAKADPVLAARRLAEHVATESEQLVWLSHQANPPTTYADYRMRYVLAG